MFLGSCNGNSQLLSLPRSTLQQDAVPPQPPVWQLVDSAVIKSLSPLQDGILVPDQYGECVAYQLSKQYSDAHL